MRAEQLRAARALLDWNQAALAEASGVSGTTIKRMEEATSGPVRGTYENVTKIRSALENAGVIFIDGSEGMGPGVRLRDASL